MPRNNRLTPKQIKAAVAAYVAGESANSVSLRLGVTLNAIRYHTKMAGVWEGRRRAEIGERFWSKVNKTKDCWIWTGASIPNGYGCITVDGKTAMAHRVAVALTSGPIPNGLHIDHLCRNRLCVKPAHLEAVPMPENVRRGMALKGRKYTLKSTQEV